MNLVDNAIIFATKAHSGMVRKFSPAPYILHPLEAMTIAGTMTDDAEILAAAVLHDTVEDTPVTLQEIEENFGSRVAELVSSETEDKREDKPPYETWQIRKEESIAFLRERGDIAVKILWLSDKLSNMRSFYRSYLKRGDDIWNDFNQKDKNKQHWYYRTIADLMPELKEYPAWQEYNILIKRVFEED